ncbi:hypothetical protein E2C01_050086 [Portunus trituberculatus]|uniref:Uncharacterized protein n=1 Tax=Portunus trituberculatus TaxID=210409 RepID=A0A5B7GFK5_PORTR|nr:hypothetical protein [Portunus trituberculatus]
MVDQARITVFALANTRAVRRESYLSHLPHWFSLASKAQLRHSDMDLDLLLNSVIVEKAMGQVQQAASVSLNEAAVKALIKVNLALVPVQPNNGSPNCTSTLALSTIPDFISGSLSQESQVISTELTLHHNVCRALWRLWGMPLMDLFATSQNFRLPAFVSPFPDPMAIAMDAFLFP